MNHYSVVKLGNGLKALLISHAALYAPEIKGGDRKSRKMSTELLAGVALGVDVGSFYDVTVSVPGMAHFCEHMMFLGSEKYPEENAFDKYLNVSFLFIAPVFILSWFPDFRNMVDFQMLSQALRIQFTITR